MVQKEKVKEKMEEVGVGPAVEDVRARSRNPSSMNVGCG